MFVTWYDYRFNTYFSALLLSIFKFLFVFFIYTRNTLKLYLLNYYFHIVYAIKPSFAAYQSRKKQNKKNKAALSVVTSNGNRITADLTSNIGYIYTSQVTFSLFLAR